MDQERLLPSSPSLHAVEAHGTDADVVSCKVVRGEQTPLLGSAKKVVGKDSGKGKRWDLRSLVLMGVLWVATLFISAAYSMIAPFFPREVGLSSGYHCCKYQAATIYAHQYSSVFVFGVHQEP